MKSGSPALPPLKAALFCLISLCIGIVISLIFAELLLRVWTPDWLSLRMKELNAGDQTAVFGTDSGWPYESSDGKFIKFKPGSQFRIRHYEYDETAHIDAYGGRAVEYDAPATSPVPFLGDSFTFGVGVADYQTYVSLLGARSKRRLVNLGVPGTALPQQLDILEKRFEELGSPKICVFTFFVGNDFSDIYSFYRESAGVSRKPAGDALLAKANRFVYHHPLLKKIYLIQFLRTTLLDLLNRNSAAPRMNPVFRIVHSKDPFFG